MKLINPNRLAKGDLISIVSPSAGIANIFPNRVERGIKQLENMGYKVKVEKNALNKEKWLSGTIEDRVNDIHDAFIDKEVKAIICSIGGNHSNQILSSLDYDLIYNNPKIFLGYSDITVLHLAIAKKANLRTFFGPSLMAEIAEYPRMADYTMEYFNKALVTGKIDNILPSDTWTDEMLEWGNEELYETPRKYASNTGYLWLKSGFANSQIVGGTIPSINHLLGTEYLPDLIGKTFFIDLPEGNSPGECLSLSDLDAYLADLYNCGVLKGLSGLIVGRPYGYNNDNEKYKVLNEIVLKYTNSYNYPILMNADIGHTSPMITVPMYANVVLDSKLNQFTIKEGFIN
jgi:muramoyltetrapeptide carboxypeptidase